MTIQKEIELASSIGSPGTPADRTARIAATLPYVLKAHPGNVLEIGAGVGDTTIKLLPLVRNEGRLLLVVDPWETLADQPPGYGVYSYGDFINKTAGYPYTMVVCKHASDSITAAQYAVDNSPYAFAFVDGLQYEHSVLMDLTLCAECGCAVICVDDYTRNTGISQVPQAVEKFLEEDNRYRLVHARNNMEAYLIKN